MRCLSLQRGGDEVEHSVSPVRRSLVGGVAGSFLAAPLAIFAQRPKAGPRIGVFRNTARHTVIE